MGCQSTPLILNYHENNINFVPFSFHITASIFLFIPLCAILTFLSNSPVISQVLNHTLGLGYKDCTLLPLYRDPPQPLVISAFAESWSTAGSIIYPTNDCFVRINQGLLPASTSAQAIWACGTYSRSQPYLQNCFERDNCEWRRPRGHPKSFWCGQVDVSCWDECGKGLHGDLLKGTLVNGNGGWGGNMPSSVCLQ